MLPLTELIRTIPEPTGCTPDSASLPITAITSDSRAVIPGALFVALKGVKGDGAAYIVQAHKQGAVAVLCDYDTQVEASGMAVLRARNPRLALAHMAAAFYGAQPAHIVAVTGTDGKTSTADFYRQFWHRMNTSSASIGTLGVLAGGGAVLYPGTHTTPDAVELHRMLADMAAKHITHVAMEASSHGLDQHRLDGVRLEAAAFTNLTRDHLDYHITDEAYFAAKARLFATLLPEGKTAVLNQDDRSFSALRDLCEKRHIRVVGYGKSGGDFRLMQSMPNTHGQHVKLELRGRPYELDVPLVGAFQVMNILAALGLVEASGGGLEQALSAVAHFTGVPGRLEHVATLGNGAAVFIDYAHTPMALANILATLRPHTQAKLHVVFGCGGDRDAGKRPEMGREADRLADAAIVTDDNPRSENPAVIRTAIMAACARGKEVADRKEAIYVALRGLGAGDILVVAGKGHEKTQIVGDKIFPFDDAAVIRDAVKELRLAT